VQYKDIEAVLAHLVGVYPDKRPRFQARLRQLQRMEFPKGINAGRSGRAHYSGDHLVQIAIAVELLQVGMTPERVIKTVELWWDKIRKGWLLAEKCPHPVIISFKPKDFSGLRSSTELSDDDRIAWSSNGCAIGTLDYSDSNDLAETVIGLVGSQRAITLNLTSISRDLAAGFEKLALDASELNDAMERWKADKDIFGQPIAVGWR
jgi:hypothetical protein